MRVQKESKTVWIFAVAEIFIIFALFSVWMTDEIASTRMGDVSFLYNRCYQMSDCFKNGFYPFLYYNDFGGVGYGSPIFYGQLTLIPFIPFLFSISVFIKVYMLCCISLNFFGFRMFLKRLSAQATLASCFYIVSMVFLGFCTGRLPVYIMGVGFSWLFWGYCIDFFRDGKHFYLLILTYFLIWQTNFVSTVFATVVCFGVFVFWFKPERLSSYIKLFLFVFCTILYNIVNILCHLDSLYHHPLDFEKICESKFAVSPFPFGGFLIRKLFYSDVCYGFLHIGVAILFVVFLWRGWKTESKRFKVGTCVIGVGVVVGYILAVCKIWPFVWDATHAFFQFPTRYVVILVGFVFVIFARVVKQTRAVFIVLTLCIADLILCNPLGIVDGIDETFPSYYPQIVNAEYVGEGFVFGDSVWNEYRSQVHSESGVEYNWQNAYNGVVVDCSSNVATDVLTLPKLYYNWYQAYGDSGEQFEVNRGYSNYCSVDIGSYTGELCLVYKVPIYVMILFLLQVFCVARCLVCAWRKDLCYARAKRK